MAVEARNFLLGLIGLDPTEASAVKSICNISKSFSGRQRSYSIADETQLDKAEILVVNPGAGSNLMTLTKINNGPAKKKPVIYIAQQLGKELDQGEYLINRMHLSSALLALLDRISFEDFKYAPELMVGSADAATAKMMEAMADRPSNQSSVARVLIIDDSQSVRTQMQLCMRLYDVTCDFAEDAETGISMTRQNDYDLVFLDVIMPGMDGYKACKFIKTDPDTQNLPVVLLTSKNSPFDKVRGVMSGSDKYLVKPLDQVRLEETLREFIPVLQSQAKAI